MREVYAPLLVCETEGLHTGAHRTGIYLTLRIWSGPLSEIIGREESSSTMLVGEPFSYVVDVHHMIIPARPRRDLGDVRVQ